MPKTEEAIEILLDLLTDLRQFETLEDEEYDEYGTNRAARATLEAAQKLASLGFVV